MHVGTHCTCGVNYVAQRGAPVQPWTRQFGHWKQHMYSGLTIRQTLSKFQTGNHTQHTLNSQLFHFRELCFIGFQHFLLPSAQHYLKLFKRQLVLTFQMAEFNKMKQKFY